MKKDEIRKIAAIGDVLAIPGFAMLVVYFTTMQGHTTQEIILLIFSACGLTADILFTVLEYVAI